MIPLFIISVLAGYLLAPCVREGLSGKPQKGDTCHSQCKNCIRFIVGVLLLVALIIIALPSFERLSILGSTEIVRILASSRVSSVLAVGILTGTLVEHWHTNIVGEHNFNEKRTLHWIWLGLIGSLMVLGIGFPYIWMVAGTAGIRSLQTAGFQIEFAEPTHGSRGTLTFEVERPDATRDSLDRFVRADELLIDRLNDDIEYYEKVRDNSESVDERRTYEQILDNFNNARLFSMRRLKPIFKCIQEARERQLDNTQTVHNSLLLAHGLRRVLAEGREFLREETDDARDMLENALSALEAGEDHAEMKFCRQTIPSGTTADFEAPEQDDFSVEEIATFSKVPHFYTLLAWFYMGANEMETALEILKEADAESVVFKNDMNYNDVHGYVLYLLDWPLAEAIRFLQRALDFANRTIEETPEKWSDGENTRSFVHRYARAQRRFRRDLAFLLAQEGKRMGEAVDYARTFFEEAGGRQKNRRRSSSSQSISIGRFHDWMASEIYWLRLDAIDSHMYYGYTLMALGARATEPDIETLLTARELFRQGLHLYDARRDERLRQEQHSTYIRLQTYLKQANRLLKEIGYFQ